MKILFDAHLSENKISGIGRYINELLTNLVKIDEFNQYFILLNENLNSNHPLTSLNKKNVTKIKVSLQGLTLRQNYLIPKFIREIKPDLYHHPHFDLPFGIQIPSIVTIHDVVYLKNPHFLMTQSYLKLFYMKNMFMRSLRKAARVIAISETTKKDLVELFHTIPDKIIPIYHGINQFHKTINEREETNILKKYSIPKPFLLYVGIRRPHKNLPILIDAFHRLIQSTRNDIYMVIIGRAYRDYTVPEEMVKKYNLQDRVRFLEYVEDTVLPTIYRQAEIFIFPSLYEGFGLPLLEAMSYDLPVIGSKCSAIPEIMGEAGLLFDPHSADDLSEKINILLNDPTRRNKLVETGRQRIKNFTWEKTARQTLQVYEDVSKKLKSF